MYVFLVLIIYSRLADDDDLAAETGVKETTREAAMYHHPTNDKIKFWDLPGIGMYGIDRSVTVIHHQNNLRFMRKCSYKERNSFELQ